MNNIDKLKQNTTYGVKYLCTNCSKWCEKRIKYGERAPAGATCEHCGCQTAIKGQ